MSWLTQVLAMTHINQQAPPTHDHGPQREYAMAQVLPNDRASIHNYIRLLFAGRRF